MESSSRKYQYLAEMLKNIVKIMLSRPFTAHIVFFVILSSSLIGYYFEPIHFTSATLIGEDRRELIKLPWSSESDEFKKFQVVANFNLGSLSNKVINIIADDCIEQLFINNQEVSVQTLPSRCDWRIGSSFELSNLLKAKNNTVNIHFSNGGGLGGLKVNGESRLHNKYFLYLIILPISFLWFFFVCMQFRLANSEFLFLAAGLTLKLIYFSYTGYWERSHDLMGSGHMGYIEYVSKHWLPPNPYSGWEYHQPPLYYYFAAVFHRISQFTGAVDRHEFLQLFSLLCSSLTALFCVVTIKLLLKSDRAKGVGTALIAFSPVHIIHSVRIGNDTFTWLCSTIAFYLCMKFLKSRSGSILISSSAASAVSMLSKYSALPNIAMSILLCGWQFRGKLKNYAVVALLLLACGMSIFLFRQIDTIQTGHRDLISNPAALVRQMSNIAVKNNFANYTQLDFNAFLLEPFLDTEKDKTGRQYFWNVLLRSAISGEFLIPGKSAVIAAKLLAVTLLMLIVMFIGGALLGWRENKEWMAWGTFYLFTCILSIAMLRYRVPVCTSGDFRYIGSAILPFVLTISYLFEKPLNLHGLNILKWLPIYFWIIGSIVLIISPII